jgi:hypothetical protein
MQAFLTRVAALSALGKWNDLLAFAESAGTVPRSLMLAAAAQAHAKLGSGSQAQKCAQDALRASAREETEVLTLRILDEVGVRATADEEIIALCGEPKTGGRMFVIARDRFERRGKPASLEAAYELASEAAPMEPGVRDYRRRGPVLSPSRDLFRHRIGEDAVGLAEIGVSGRRRWLKAW